MEMNLLEQILRTVSETARYPVIIALLCFLGFSLFSIGMTASEAWYERRHIHYHLSHLLEKLQEGDRNALEKDIRLSGLPARHKKILLELASHPSFDRGMLESLEDNLMEKEQAHYSDLLSATSLVARLAPMAGLLGTLIPLGPGIIALSSGDTAALSRSLLTAFDTTTIGLISAAICLVIGCIRRHWYTEYMSDLQTLADGVVDRCSRQEFIFTESNDTDARYK